MTVRGTGERQKASKLSPENNRPEEDDLSTFAAAADNDYTGADLRGRNFENRTLRGAIFSRADLRGSRFTGANLIDADFFKADLSSDRTSSTPKPVDLSGAKLAGTRFTDADLTDANLSDVTGLDVHAFAGANLLRATIPKESWSLDLISHTDETIKGCRTIYVTLLTACVYCLITVVATSDAHLVLTYGASTLPMLSASMTLKNFYFAAPLLLLLLFIYFHIYLQRLFEKLAMFPAVLPDGRPLDEVCRTWLLGGMIREQFSRLKSTPLTFRMLSFVSSRFSAWWLAPTCIGILWWRGLVAIDPWLTYSQAIFLISAVVLGLRVRIGSARTLSTHQPQKAPLAVLAAASILVAIPIILVSELYIPTGDIVVPPEADFRGKSLQKKRLASGMLALARFDHAELQYTDLRESVLRGGSMVRANLTGARLNRADLRDANLDRATLINADFTDADLEQANMTSAVMAHANMTRAKIAQADLTRADLLCVTLRDASLYRTILADAELAGADLSNADLELVDFTDANLDETVLTGAKNLDSAVGLTEAQLEKACGEGVLVLGQNGDKTWQLKQCTHVQACPKWLSKTIAKNKGATL